MKQFTYCIARKWDDKELMQGVNVCIFTIASRSIFQGTIKDAIRNKNLVNNHYLNVESGKQDYKIVKINYEVLEN